MNSARLQYKLLGKCSLDSFWYVILAVILIVSGMGLFSLSVQSVERPGKNLDRGDQAYHTSGFARQNWRGECAICVFVTQTQCHL